VTSCVTKAGAYYRIRDVMQETKRSSVHESSCGLSMKVGMFGLWGKIVCMCSCAAQGMSWHLNITSPGRLQTPKHFFTFEQIDA
jgi:hypothetical protein